MSVTVKSNLQKCLTFLRSFSTLFLCLLQLDDLHKDNLGEQLSWEIKHAQQDLGDNLNYQLYEISKRLQLWQCSGETEAYGIDLPSWQSSAPLPRMLARFCMLTLFRLKKLHATVIPFPKLQIIQIPTARAALDLKAVTRSADLLEVLAKTLTLYERLCASCRYPWASSSTF